ncbi:MAG: hypothetical protein WBB98_17445 [Xanthobacteraceae bacterium]
MANNPKNRVIDDPKAGPPIQPNQSDLNDPNKAPGTGISPKEDQPDDAPLSETAREFAEETIDELTDDCTGDAEVERRKRELLDGPAELRGVRRDVEK